MTYNLLRHIAKIRQNIIISGRLTPWTPANLENEGAQVKLLA